MSRAGAAQAPPVRRHWSTATVLGSAMFLVLFDSLAVATALPKMGADLTLRPEDLQWVVSLYSLGIGALLLPAGRLCDLWSRRTLLMGSLVLCAAASLLAGMATDLPLLLTGRVLQGVAAAFALPATLAIAAEVFPDEPWRSRVFSVVAVSGNLAGLAGAICGGLLADHLGWRWVFLAPVPVCALAAVAIVVVLPRERPVGRAGKRFDIAGACLAAAGMAAVVYGCGRVADGGTVLGVGSVVTGLILFGVLAAVERRVSAPLIATRLVRSRALITGCAAFAAHCAAYISVVVVGSLYLQDVHGLSAASSGLMLVPVLLGAVVAAVPASVLVRRFGSRSVVSTCLASGTVFLVLAALNAGGEVIDVVPWLVAWGVSAGPVHVALTRVCVAEADPAERGAAAGIFESTSHVSGASAVAIYLSLLGTGADYQHVGLLAAGILALGVAATLAIPRRSR